MVNKVVITNVNRARWLEAQKFSLESASRSYESGDDWNHWWKEKFDGYRVLEGKKFENVLEVGCGPHTNLRLILPLIEAKNLYFEDPLIRDFFDFFAPASVGWKRRWFGWLKPAKPGPEHHLKKIVEDRRYRVDLTSDPLEELPYKDKLMDLIVCNNVLDHVMDAGKCMKEMHRVLKKGGLVVLGQDLSDEEDYRRSPDSWKDVGHPIKLDEKTINKYMVGYERIFYNVLPREEGRNPAAHYGTYLLIGRKG
ncbi:methyltransferase domain-containing protein [Candidatus Saccharibacteria bacterium]|nr:methyltransferase domain-containing protein [Candidatus Saccharibacteria bacterium]